MSVFLRPRQPFPSNEQIAHISISGSACGLNDGNEKKGIVGTHKQPLGLQTPSTNRGRSDLTMTGKNTLVPQIQRCYVCPWLGSFSTSSSVLIGLCREVLSSNSVGSVSGRWRGPKVSFGSRPLPTSEIRTMGHNSRRRHIKHHLSVQLSLLSVVAGPCSPAAFWLSHQLQPSGAGRKEEEELPGHTGLAIKRQRGRSPFSRCSHSKWSWTRERSLPVPTSVSSASFRHRPWPGRWSRAQPAALVGKSILQEGLAPAAEHLHGGIRLEAKQAKWAHVR